MPRRIYKELGHVFVLRFWHESPLDKLERGHWRARVRDGATGKEIYADGIEEAFELVRAMLMQATGKSARDPDVQCRRGGA